MHYYVVRPSADPTDEDGQAVPGGQREMQAVFDVVDRCVSELRLQRLVVRTPGFARCENRYPQGAYGHEELVERLYDGAAVDATDVGPLLAASHAISASGDFRGTGGLSSGFWGLIEGERDFSVAAGYDYTTFIVSPRELPEAEALADERGITMLATSQTPFWLEDSNRRPAPHTPVGPGFADHILGRIEREGPLFCYEMWLRALAGNRGFLLRDRQSLDFMMANLKPRSALAVFSGDAVIPVHDIDADLIDGISDHVERRALTVAGLAGSADSGWRIEHYFSGAIDCRDEIPGWLSDERRADGDALFVYFGEQWSPPDLELFVLPDSDGVVRSRMAFA
ncbi:hypothetical protein R8Z50_08870 [Longispora sp. K20-0274]|uniref:hypothetical protein n=1 Tax=Longispora sp. K20-0274 TaxID=3088255 RepID=UPI00399BB8D0